MDIFLTVGLGLKSLARSEILGDGDRGPVKTGFAAYRATIDTKLMQSDPDISWLLKEPALNIWYVLQSFVWITERSMLTYLQDWGRTSCHDIYDRGGQFLQHGPVAYGKYRSSVLVTRLQH